MGVPADVGSLKRGDVAPGRPTTMRANRIMAVRWLRLGLEEVRKAAREGRTGAVLATINSIDDQLIGHEFDRHGELNHLELSSAMEDVDDPADEREPAELVRGEAVRGGGLDLAELAAQIQPGGHLSLTIYGPPDR
jgi:hypothetical protein